MTVVIEFDPVLVDAEAFVVADHVVIVTGGKGEKGDDGDRGPTGAAATLHAALSDLGASGHPASVITAAGPAGWTTAQQALDGLHALAVALDAADDTEATSRATADTDLAAALVVLGAALTSADAAEETRALAAEGALDDAIADEATLRAAIDGAHTTAITTETNRATAAEGVLTTSVAARATTASLATETADRVAGDAAVAASVTAEETRALAAEAALAAAIESNAAVYSTEVLADAPLGFWPLDDASGTTAVDASGNGQDGTYLGTPALASDDVLGFICPAFDGTDDMVVLPAIDVGAGPFTIEVIARCDVTKNECLPITERGSDAGGLVIAAIGTGVGSEMGSSVIGAGGYHGGGNWKTTTDGTVWGSGDEHHLAYTYDGTTGRFYIDGDEVSSHTYTATASNGGWDIGTNHGRSNFWDGAIAGVGIYDTCLSAARIQAHAGAAFNVPPAGPPGPGDTADSDQSILALRLFA